MSCTAIHYVTFIEIVDRCDFDRIILRRAMLGDCEREGRAWGEVQCENLLAEKAEAFAKSNDPADDPDTFDPQARVNSVELA